VNIFIGDSFKFLANNQATYDIIVTIPLPSSYQNLCVFEEGKGIRPPFSLAAAVLSSKQPMKEALFSSGLFTRPCGEYVVPDPSKELTIGTYNFYHSYYHYSISAL